MPSNSDESKAKNSLTLSKGTRRTISEHWKSKKAGRDENSNLHQMNVLAWNSALHCPHAACELSPENVRRLFASRLPKAELH